jgi:UDP-3-O-[3-hydroxymyristoyl] glucosamine N-acyltransferase
VARSAQISPGAVVLPGATIGEGSSVGPNAVIYGGSVIGARVSVGAGAVIGRPGFGWVTGPNGRLRRMPQRGGVQVDDEVEIGALCTVDAGTLDPTRIGAGTKLDAHVHVGHNVQIGRHCLVAAQSGFAGSVVIEDDVWIGGQVGVKDHVRIGAGARLAAKSGVIGDVPPGATVAGFPAVPRLRWLRAMARLLSG